MFQVMPNVMICLTLWRPLLPCVCTLLNSNPVWLWTQLYWLLICTIAF